MPNRREFLSYLGALSAAPHTLANINRFKTSGDPIAFSSLPHGVDKTHHVTNGYHVQVLLRWGDTLTGEDWSNWDPARLTRSEQERRFGYNNVFIAFLPLPRASNNSGHGLLCINHEYTNTAFLWPGLSRSSIRRKMDITRTAVEIAAVGHSVVEVTKDGPEWRTVDGPYNRRYTGFSRCALTGPVSLDA